MATTETRPFELDTFLCASGCGKTTVSYRPSAVVFAQGDIATAVHYIRTGSVTLSVGSQGGREAVVAMLGPGDFFGEAALAGQVARLETAIARTATTALVVPTGEMVRLLHEEPSLSDRFIGHLLARNIRIEADLVDQLLNSSEKRLARALLLLAPHGKPEHDHQSLPKISQATLADMIGTTRSRVNFFINKFKKLGLIEDRRGLKINQSLLTAILHD